VPSPVERRDRGDICVHYEKGEEDVFLLLKGNYVIKMKEESVGDGGEVAKVATPTPTSTPEESEVIEICVVNYTRAPKTWTIDMPQNFNKVEAGVYGKGEGKVNQYGGWAAYMKLNGDYAWKFLRHDENLGGIIHDYIQGREVQESVGKGMWLDVRQPLKIPNLCVGVR